MIYTNHFALLWSTIVSFALFITFFVRWRQIEIVNHGPVTQANNTVFFSKWVCCLPYFVAFSDVCWAKVRQSPYSFFHLFLRHVSLQCTHSSQLKARYPFHHAFPFSRCNSAFLGRRSSPNQITLHDSKDSCCLLMIFPAIHRGDRVWLSHFLHYWWFQKYGNLYGYQTLAMFKYNILRTY